jgi:hypothetical protein
MVISFYFSWHLITEHLNSSDMKQITNNQEILLLPASSFFNRDWCEKGANSRSKQLSQKEQVIELCWNGMLPHILPEICETLEGEKNRTLWEINETGNLLDLRLGEFNHPMNNAWSINPYIFMVWAELN